MYHTHFDIENIRGDYKSKIFITESEVISYLNSNYTKLKRSVRFVAGMLGVIILVPVIFALLIVASPIVFVWLFVSMRTLYKLSNEIVIESKFLLERIDGYSFEKCIETDKKLDEYLSKINKHIEILDAHKITFLFSNTKLRRLKMMRDALQKVKDKCNDQFQYTFEDMGLTVEEFEEYKASMAHLESAWSYETPVEDMKQTFEHKKSLQKA